MKRTFAPPPRSLRLALKPRGAQSALARQLGVSRSFLCLVAQGKRQPSLGIALEIERLTGVPVRSLVRKRRAA